MGNEFKKNLSEQMLRAYLQTLSKEFLIEMIFKMNENINKAKEPIRYINNN